MSKLLWMALAVVLVAGPMGSVRADECLGVTLPDSATVGGQNLVLNGMGVREATVFNVNVYVAGLYVESASRSGDDIISSAGPKRLVLHFVRDVDGSDIADAWEDGFDANAGPLMPMLSDRMRTLNGYMEDMREGEEMVFTYDPASGLEVSVDGDVKGTIAGEDFARVFFSIWLGSSPPNPGLKRGLLGGSCG